MPEGALSSDNEGNKKNGELSDEFKALDINLDEPLRDDEKLFIPKAYQKPIIDNPYALPKSDSYYNGVGLDVANPNGEKPKKKSKSKKSKKEGTESKPKKASTKSAEKQRKRKKSEKSIEENYTSLSSTAKPGKDTAVKAEKLIVPEDTTTVVSNEGSQVSKLQSLAENSDLKIRGRIVIVANSSNNESRGNATIKFKNKGSDTIRRLELSVFENDQVKLDMSSGIKDASSIMLPFELTSNATNEHVLHFEFNKVDKTQKIRVTLMYCIEKNDGKTTEDRLNFILTFPSLRFLVFATIGATSYELIISSGDLSGSSSERASSTQPLNVVTEKITTLSNFSIVDAVEEAASLYAHTFDDSPVCVLIKKLPTDYAIDVRCTEATLAHSLAHDLKEIIQNIGE